MTVCSLSCRTMASKKKRHSASFTNSWKVARREVSKLTSLSEVDDFELELQGSCSGSNVNAEDNRTQSEESVSILHDPLILVGDDEVCSDLETNTYETFGEPECTEADEASMQWDLIDKTNLEIISDSDSDEDSPNRNSSLNDELVHWINDYQVKHNAADSLLKLLKENGHPELPGSARTLLHTAREVETQVKSGMDYIYFDIKSELVKHLNMYSLEYRTSIDDIEISLNIDGLPLFVSSKKTLWPVLCALWLKPVKIFPVALLCGRSKPENLDFLQDTMDGLQGLLNTGLDLDGKHIDIHLRCIVCDAPAKALVKNIKQYSGYYGCDRCCQKGQWLGRLTYQETDNLTLRTDVSFRQEQQQQHHHGRSPFCDLPIDMVSAFPVDYMHQVCIGVMKRLLLMWLRGKRTVKMSAGQVQEVSRRLENLQQFTPSLFARKPRGLLEIDRWKATEFRQFLLYTGKLVLKGVLKQDLFDHFMTFSVAICILISPQLALLHNTYAKDLLRYFVEQGRYLYGPEFLVYNVHSMLHLAADALVFGNLDKFSAFPFENYLCQLKRLVRSGKNPLAQIVKRLNERMNVCNPINPKELKVATHRPNNSYILTNSCCEVTDTTGQLDENHQKKYLCRVYNRITPLFENPCSSVIIGAFKVDTRHSEMKILSEKKLDKRAIFIQSEQGHGVFLSVLHDI